MEDALCVMRESLQDALDQISSPRSASETRIRALETVERHLASSCAVNEDTEQMDYFLALQYTFECNVPLRLLPWIAVATNRLENLTKGSEDETQDLEACLLASQLTVVLSLIQGVSLIHTASKDYLGRKYALEVLLDLLLTSRHLPAPVTDPSPSLCRKQNSSSLPLTSLVLDTLLCILVDSSSALRCFEVVNGPQAVVKILKRAGTPREVRMKCLEFLYFYLLDETLLDETPSTQADLAAEALKSTPPPTAPPTPLRPPKPYLSATPLRPASTYGSSTFLFSDSTSSSGRSSRSASGSSTQSFSSTSSNASSSTAASSVTSSPEKSSSGKAALLAKSPGKLTSRMLSSQQHQPQTPLNSPPLASHQKFPQPLQPRSLMMLKKEVDFVPLSPKKPQATGLGISPRHNPKSKSMSIIGSGEKRLPSRLASSDSVPGVGKQLEAEPLPLKALRNIGKGDDQRRTTEQKKELLGTMLGNVDALVEGVRKAGIWGLG